MKLYQNLARCYDLLYSYRDYEREIDFIIDELQNTKKPRLLDVACGTGNHLCVLRKRIPESILVGVDLNEGMLEVAKGKKLDARLEQGDMRNFNLNNKFDLVYCLSSSIQYNLSEEDFKKTLHRMRAHVQCGKIIFDVAFCEERWKEGYTNITANSNEKFQVAELFTSHSKGNISYWNPLYLIKDNETGVFDMHVDKQIIRIWSVEEIRNILKQEEISFRLEKGFNRKGKESDIPIFVLE